MDFLGLRGSMVSEDHLRGKRNAVVGAIRELGTKRVVAQCQWIVPK